MVLGGVLVGVLLKEHGGLVLHTSHKNYHSPASVFDAQSQPQREEPSPKRQGNITTLRRNPLAPKTPVRTTRARQTGTG